MEKKKKYNEKRPDSEPKQVRGAKERKFTTEADRRAAAAGAWGLLPRCVSAAAGAACRSGWARARGAF